MRLPLHPGQRRASDGSPLSQVPQPREDPDGDAGGAPTVAGIETPRLRLQPADASLARALADDRRAAGELCGAILHREFPDTDLMRMLPAYAASLQAAPRSVGWGLWLLVFKRDRTVVGGIGFKGPPAENGDVAVGYSVVRAHRRRGLAVEATDALIRWAFVDARVRRVVAECQADNVASVGVLRRLGFARLPDVSAAETIRWQLPRDTWRQRDGSG